MILLFMPAVINPLTGFHSWENVECNHGLEMGKTANIPCSGKLKPTSDTIQTRNKDLCIKEDNDCGCPLAINDRRGNNS